MDWQQRFSEFAAERRSMPFEWGRNDCCLFAADAVLAIAGTDPAADLRGRYSDALGAMRLVEDQGGLRAIAFTALGEAVSPLMAGVGDVVLITNEGRELLAICNGVDAIGPGLDGMVALSMAAAIAAWKV
jgi:hypothetical protein